MGWTRVYFKKFCDTIFLFIFYNNAFLFFIQIWDIVAYLILFCFIAVDKVETLKRYKFSLAFENSNEEDYVTEKFFQSLVAGMEKISASILSFAIFQYYMTLFAWAI